MTHGMVRIWLRAEGLAVLSASLWLYAQHGQSWGMLALLFLAPDLSFAAYLVGPRLGAIVYNFAHTYALPLASGLVLAASGNADKLPLLLIWTAHIGFDRALGYGLKYPTGFGSTHLGPIGRARTPASPAAA